MPVILPLTAESIYTRAKFFLNDGDGAVFNESSLKEALNAAIDDLREELQDNDISVTAEVSTAIEVPAGSTNIGGDSGIALPGDLVVPIQLWEKTQGTNQDYMIMEKREFLPKLSVATTFLMYWTYQDQIIKFIDTGATSDLNIKIDYRANRIFDVVNNNSQINLKNAKSFLSLKTAAYAAQFIGENETRASNLEARAEEAKGLILNLDIKNKQNQITRKRPFMASYKMRGFRY